MVYVLRQFRFTTKTHKPVYFAPIEDILVLYWKGMMSMFDRVKRISTFVLLCCTHLLSLTSADTRSRRFIGLPETGQRVYYSNASENSRTVIVRHNLQGRIIFHESNEFWIEVLTTTSEGQNNSNVKTLYTSLDNNTILLQVHQSILTQPDKASETDKVLVIILSSVGAFAFLGLVVSALCYFCYWKKRQRTGRKEANEGSTTPKTGRRVALGGQGGKSGATLGATQLAVVSICACALHAQLQPVNVGINVYFPRGFLRPDSKVFLNSENNNEVRVITNDTKLKINVFDVVNAGLISENRCSDRNLTCINGACDPMVGKCVCPRKMRANRQAGGQTRCVFKCNEKCPKGSFELSPCNHTHPAVCKKCRPLCSFKEFESVPCAGKTDRSCTDISKLPRIKTSPNIVHEDVLKVKHAPPVRKTISSFSKDSSTWLHRSSGLAIQIKMLRVDFSTTFQEVKHAINDNNHFPNDALLSDIVKNYCSSPVPDYYGIKLNPEGKVKYIKGNPNKTCPSYDGNSKSIPPAQGDSLTCNGVDNPIVSLFGVNRFFLQNVSKEEHSKSCYDHKQNCNKCREKCTSLVRENPLCNLTDKDVRDSKQDYGEHFTNCFDCCFQENCTCSSCACSLYNASCIGSQLTCVEVERFAIPIEPVFPSSGNFKCHVELSHGPVFELETSLWKDGKLIGRIESSNKNNNREGVTGHGGNDYGYMVLKHPSLLKNDMNKMVMISGRAGKPEFDVGWFKTETERREQNLSDKRAIQTKEPFKINSRVWPGENCPTFNTERFVPISSSGPISNFKKISKLSAQVAYENDTRVYKVHNNSGLRQVHVEIPQGRSILQYVFPDTVIFNDRSFTGQLLKNRTFWTIRLTGRVSSCPGFLVVRLTDQDRPDVDVYHFDIAITNQDCSFTVEFHLPSGGDTNLIDKQFVVRLTDSRKTMKLILVSPRRIPEFEIPDFDDDFDLKRLEILISFGGASGGMLIVLIAILIYGYKTRPKDSYHRDRDNELHFRHLLFVVWFVGMRLVKSFLLTLTVLFVILTAIHYTNVKTLQEYETFHKQQKKVEEDFIKQMDAHKVQEINRQWALLQEGKLICDNKLHALNSFLEKHFKEMKEKQEEEMRRKSILLAALNRIERQFNATRAKFEIERKRLNEQMKSYSDEINSRLSQIQGKIDRSFWLKAAKGLHKALKGLASIFGKSIKPFIEWVGLKVNFPNINVEMSSFDDIFAKFKMTFSSLNSSDSGSGSSSQEYFPIDTKINIEQISVPELNISSPLNNERAKELLALEWIVHLYRSGVFTTILIVLDILWFVYRHTKTYQLAIVLVHGFPKIYELEEIKKKEEKKEEKKKKKEEKFRKKVEETIYEENEDNSFEDSTDEIEKLQENELDKIQKKEERKEEKKKDKDKKLKKEFKRKECKKKQHKIKDEDSSVDRGVDEIEDLQEIHVNKTQKKEKRKEDAKMKKEKKLKKKAKKKVGNEKGQDNFSFRSSADEVNLGMQENVLWKIQKKFEEESKEKKENDLQKKAEKIAKKKEDNLLESNSEGKENLHENSVREQGEIKKERGKTSREDQEKPHEHKETTRYIETGKEKEHVAEDEDHPNIENIDDKEVVSEEPKRKKVISHGLKGLDSLNTAFVKFIAILKELNYQINNTNLVPLSLLAVIAILTVYVVIVTAKHTMNVDTLDVIGFFDLKMAPLLTMRKIVNTRITSNAFMVNEVHIPYYENRVNARIAFHRKKAEMYQAYQCAKADLHNEEYCSWAGEPGVSCEGVGPCNQDFLKNLTQFECNLEPVFPQRFTKFDRIRYKEVHKKAIAPYLAALRGLILDTFYIILIVIGIFIILKILGIAVFMLLKKFDLVRQVKYYQVNQDLKKGLTVQREAPNCIKNRSKNALGRSVRAIKLNESFKAKVGPQIREDKYRVWTGH